VPKWLLPWLFPLGLVVAVIAIAVSPVIGAALAVAAGLVVLPFVFREYQSNRSGRGGGGRKPPRADPPNNRSLLR
jgi:hypothetical protein